MLLSTTPQIEGYPVKKYLGLVTGETIIGANFVRDFLKSITDVVGGRSSSYERVLREAKEKALAEMSADAHRLGGNAIVGVDLDYETIGDSMLMVMVSGTAVVI